MPNQMRHMELFVQERNDGSVGIFVAGPFASAFCSDYHGRSWAPFLGSLIMLFNPCVGDLPLRVGISKLLEELVGLLLNALVFFLGWRPFGLGYTSAEVFTFLFNSGIFEIFIKATRFDLRSLLAILFAFFLWLPKAVSDTLPVLGVADSAVPDQPPSWAAVLSLPCQPCRYVASCNSNLALRASNFAFAEGLKLVT
jgi:hypothetical protein